MPNMIDTPDLDAAIANAAALKADGIETIAGYFFGGPSWKQLLTAERAKALSAAGFSLISIYETNPTNIGYFTNQRAIQDAATALVRAVDAGHPTSAPIFLAADTDVPEADMGTVCAYFSVARGHLKLHSQYHIGVYGSGALCQRLMELGLVEATWLSESTGWNGYDDWKDKADILQIESVTLHGVSCDTDELRKASVAWTV
jgi:hypothetical protein